MSLKLGINNPIHTISMYKFCQMFLFRLMLFWLFWIDELSTKKKTPFTEFQFTNLIASYTFYLILIKMLSHNYLNRSKQNQNPVAATAKTKMLLFYTREYDFFLCLIMKSTLFHLLLFKDNYPCYFNNLQQFDFINNGQDLHQYWS